MAKAIGRPCPLLEICVPVDVDRLIISCNVKQSINFH